MARVYAVMGRKGGVGKTTIAVNLAAVVGQNHPAAGPDDPAPVVAVGIDPQGSLEAWADRVPEEGLPFDYASTRGRPGVLAELAKDPAVSRIFVDSPGFMDTDPEDEYGQDPLGRGTAADALRDMLGVADMAIVPITPDFLTHEPAEYTIERVLKPRKIPFIVVINLWDPRDGSIELDEARKWCAERRYLVAPSPVRRYKVHAHAARRGTVVTQYQDSGTTLRAREDFFRLSLAIEQVKI